MRPMTLDDVVGHDHIVGKDSLLRGLIDSNGTGSLILVSPFFLFLWNGVTNRLCYGLVGPSWLW